MRAMEKVHGIKTKATDLRVKSTQLLKKQDIFKGYGNENSRNDSTILVGAI